MLQLYTHVLGWLGGKPDAAAPLVARLVDVDPLNAMSLLVNAMVPSFAGRFPEAVDSARRMVALGPVTITHDAQRCELGVVEGARPASI